MIEYNTAKLLRFQPVSERINYLIVSVNNTKIPVSIKAPDDIPIPMVCVV